MGMKASDLQEVDFIVLSEDYSRYLVHDGAIIKAKIVVKKILFSPQKTPEGYPSNYSLDSSNAVVAIVPPSLKRPPSTEPINLQKDKGDEMKFEDQEVKVQEYMTTNGFKISVKPIVTKIFRYNKYDIYGDPIYNVVVQAIINIEKIASTTG